MSASGMSRYGHDILCVFDVWQDHRDFLADVIESIGAPAETERLLRQSLMAGAEDLQNLIECAESIRRVRGGPDLLSLDGQDVLAIVHEILHGAELRSHSSKAWEETDRLIAKAKALEQDARNWPLPSVAPLSQAEASNAPQPTARPKKNRTTTSHYWSDQNSTLHSAENQRCSNTRQIHPNSTFPATQSSSTLFSQHASSLPDPVTTSSHVANNKGEALHSLRNRKIHAVEDAPSSLVKKSSAISPYFSPFPPEESKTSPVKRRPPAGTIATVPFAPLTASRFGIVQEQFAHEPFWLLIAVTFLVKTKGKVAMPVFYKVRERFPTPEHIADPSNRDEIVDMIRHLGLSSNRVGFMQKYARGFLETPPRPDVRYKVRNYDHRDVDPSLRASGPANDSLVGLESMEGPSEGDAEDLETWEIGHLTKGKYALDSWRIFCRDELLGRAEDWNGKCREAEFQPEWMRVKPSDKELRAYLRWMWMREGWEWDPVTGERTVLREEMRQAVNEGRVEYDDTGGLRILDNDE